MNLTTEIKGAPEQIKKMTMSFNLAIQILNSDEFRQAVLEQDYEVVKCTGFWKWKKCSHTLEQGFTSTNKTREEIYKSIQGMTMHVKWICDSGSNRNVIGYTYADKLQINTYLWVITSYTIYELAGHFIHEMLHCLGYSHSSAKDHNSVPYALGFDAEMIGKRLVLK